MALHKQALLKYFFTFALLLSSFYHTHLAAEETGMGLYLLGYQSAKAGYLPPPGLYFRNDAYHHPGHIKGGVFGGVAQLKANAKISLDLLTLTYVSPLQFLGADVACSVLVPIGRINVHASAQVNVGQLLQTLNSTAAPSKVASTPSTSTATPMLPTLPTTITKKKHQVAHGISDMLVIPLMLGWHYDNFHMLAFQGLFLPTGRYKKGHIANMGQNHYATETDAGITYLNKNMGTEISLISGLTVNFTNHKIHYRSGTGWHTEFFAGQYLTRSLELGLAGYWFYQLTKDSGKGALLGGFRGRVLGLGPCLSYDFKIKDFEFNANVRYYKESNAKHYLKGESFWLTVSIPIFTR